MVTGPLNTPASGNTEKLPVNVREFTDKRHIVVRLDQVQRAILKDPEVFERLEKDRSLDHVRTEVEQLQDALTAYAKQGVDYEFSQLQRVFKMMQAWSAEEELSDVLTLDRHRYDEIQAEKDMCEIYPDYVDLLPRLKAESGFTISMRVSLKTGAKSSWPSVKKPEKSSSLANRKWKSLVSAWRPLNPCSKRSIIMPSAPPMLWSEEWALWWGSHWWGMYQEFGGAGSGD